MLSPSALLAFSTATMILLIIPGPAALATAFTVVKLVGAAYLIWLGVQSIQSYRRGFTPQTGAVTEERALRRIFVDGVVLNVLNPKTAIFFLSFVPQFVDPNAAEPAGSVALLGTIFIGLGLLSDGVYAMAGGWFGTRLRRSPRLQRRKDLLAGSTYLGLGAITALSGSRSH